MESLIVDASVMTFETVKKLAKPINFDMSPRGSQGFQWKLIEKAIGNWPIGKEIIDCGSARPALSVRPPQGCGVTNPSIFTLAGGLVGGACDGIGVSGGAGIYGSNNGERGYYLGGGIQAQTNVSVSIGGEVTYIFGPPSDFAGLSVAGGIDIGPNLVAGSVRLIFQLPTFRFLGVSLGISVGVSVLPANLTLEVGYTKTFPYRLAST